MATPRAPSPASSMQNDQNEIRLASSDNFALLALDVRQQKVRHSQDALQRKEHRVRFQIRD